jgi:hypothetical protein
MIGSMKYICDNCGIEFFGKNRKERKFRFCSKKCFHKSNFAKTLPSISSEKRRKKATVINGTDHFECSKCLLLKSREFFASKQNGSIHSWCRSCENANLQKKRKKIKSICVSPEKLVSNSGVKIPNLNEDQIKRFWDNVSISDKESCWNWKGMVNFYGYGQFNFNYKSYKAHRVSWFLKNKKDPIGIICHKCDNRLCVNPSHLFDGEHSDNRADAVKKGRISKGIKHSIAILPSRKRGENHFNSKLKPSDIPIIRSLFGKKTHKEIGEMFGVGKFAIWCIYANKTWKHIK